MGVDNVSLCLNLMEILQGVTNGGIPQAFCLNLGDSG